MKIKIFLTPSKDTEILEFNQYKKPGKVPFTIYAYLECIMEKIDGCKNNPENSSTTKVSKHVSVFQCLQYLHLEELKGNMAYTEVKIAWKSFVNL